MLTNCLNEGTDYNVLSVVSQVHYGLDHMLRNHLDPPQDLIQPYRSVYARQNINHDLRVLYDHPASSQDMVQSYCSVYAPQNINHDLRVSYYHTRPEDQVLYHYLVILQNMQSYHYSIYISQKIHTNQPIFTKQLPFDIELYLRLLFNFNNFICTLTFETTLIKQRCQRLRLKLIQTLMLVHDFAVYIRQLQTHHICNITLLYQLILHHYFQYTFEFITELLLYIYMMKKISNESNSHFQYAGINYIGGGSKFFSITELSPHLQSGTDYNDVKFSYKDYVKVSQCYQDTNTVQCTLPFTILLPKLTIDQLKVIAASHGIYIHGKAHHANIQAQINRHMCINCATYISSFNIVDITKLNEASKAAKIKAVKQYQAKKGEEYKILNLKSVKKYQKQKGDEYKSNHSKSEKIYKDKKKIQDIFPPSPATPALQHMIISNACQDMSSEQLSESGCAVCGQLTLVKDLINLSDAKVDLNILINPGITQIERMTPEDPIKDIEGPVLVKGLHKLCQTCYKSLSKGKIPLASLANGKWLGNVPSQLLDLSFAEQLLIARVRHNRCIVRVSSGMHKMRANAITFANPIPKVYDILPPPIEELDEVLAFIYTGPCKPTKSDFERTPLLVRRKKVRAALEWLKLNHCDYYDLEISQRNLDQYPEDGPPVIVDYQESFTNKNSESTAVNDMDDEDGVESGKCPFVVHGLTGEEYSNKTTKALKAIALKHLTSNKKILAVGHATHPESIYSNPKLFPQMMPWLFPYALGGIGDAYQQGRVSHIKHKKHLLIYYDKQFQKDPYFSLIAFNHEQIKQCTIAGYSLAEKSMFQEISNRLLDVDMTTLTDIFKQMKNGNRVIPETDKEKMCFQLIKDIDHVGGGVKGFFTSKKYMRNEIWSLISFVGAPSWFITFAPADNKHPISLYFADTQETFNPIIRDYNEHYRLIAHNPVAGARFFHFMSELFIKHVLGVGEDHPGIYGNTEAYYGTVEQQGQLTLHMHMLLWLRGSLSPQTIRDKIMDPNSDFQQRMFEYLESAHIGEFLTGNITDIKAKILIVIITKIQHKHYQNNPHHYVINLIINVMIIVQGLFYLAPQGAPKFPRTPLPYIVIAKGIISTYQF